MKTATQFIDKVIPNARFIGPDYPSLQKTAGMALGANGCLYCVPWFYDKVIKIDPLTRIVSDLSTSYPGNRKWLGAAAHPNGKIYCAPFDASGYLEIDPATDTTRIIPSAYGKARSIASHPNGKFYSFRSGVNVPSQFNQIIEFDPINETTNLVGPLEYPGVTGSSFRSTIMGKDNKIYSSSGDSHKIIRYDPLTDIWEIFNTNQIIGNNAHAGMCLARDNDNIYYTNDWDGNQISWFSISDGIPNYASGFQYKKGNRNYSITPAANGNLYAAPSTNFHVTVHDVVKGRDSPFGPFLGNTEYKFSSIKSAGNGNLYLAPRNMTRVLEIYNVGSFNSFSEVYNFDLVTNEPTVYMRGI